eukprot:TRINITY_DN19479_c0_g1_i1.p1 TRINITY_DN19479_c0_g1~~TRINITY_DN19479_c0_g1_i1.p1  ORF type:complete len:301 (+),score=35.19 TRINITY_DN19479_c0_g1_i1:99-1001(+)
MVSMVRHHGTGMRSKSLVIAVVAVAAIAIQKACVVVFSNVGGHSDLSSGLRSSGRRAGLAKSRLSAGWEFGRFTKTVEFFRGSPWKILLPKFLQNPDKQVRRGSAATDASATEEVVIDWGKTDGMPVAESWGPLDDVVMGGVSLSRLSQTEEDGNRWLSFCGQTSRANNGGFCSFRSRVFSPPFDLSTFDGLVFQARCKDGLRYKLQVRDNDGWDSVGWAIGFDTLPNGQETEVRLPFSSFIPNFRSQTKRDAQPLKKKEIYSIQFVLSAFEFDGDMNPRFKEGEFNLQLGAIRGYRQAS